MDRPRPAAGRLLHQTPGRGLAPRDPGRGAPGDAAGNGPDRATFADAAAEYLRYVHDDRGRKPSTLRGYRSAIEAHLLPAFGDMPVEDVTAEAIERWMVGFGGSVRTRNKLLIQLHGILGRARKVYGLRVNAAAEVEKFSPRASGEIQVFSPEEVWALVRAASSEQDGALFSDRGFHWAADGGAAGAVLA